MLTYFYNAIETTKADLGVFTTLEPPTAGMIEYANGCGYFKEDVYGNTYHRFQIMTVEELLDGKRPAMPGLDTAHVKSAKKKDIEGEQEQIPGT